MSAPVGSLERPTLSTYGSVWVFESVLPRDLHDPLIGANGNLLIGGTTELLIAAELYAGEHEDSAQRFRIRRRSRRRPRVEEARSATVKVRAASPLVRCFSPTQRIARLPCSRADVSSKTSGSR